MNFDVLFFSTVTKFYWALLYAPKYFNLPLASLPAIVISDH